MWILLFLFLTFWRSLSLIDLEYTWRVGALKNLFLLAWKCPFSSHKLRKEVADKNYYCKLNVRLLYFNEAWDMNQQKQSPDEVFYKKTVSGCFLSDIIVGYLWFGKMKSNALIFTTRQNSCHNASFECFHCKKKKKWSFPLRISSVNVTK